MTITQLKRGEVPVWVIGVMVTAVTSMAGALAFQDRIHRAEIAQKDAEITKCMEDRTKAESAFREEIKSLYKEVQDFREEIYRAASTRQNKRKK